QRHAAARREGGRRAQLRAHPPLQPGRHGRAAAAVQGRRELGDARAARRRTVRHRRAGGTRAATGDRHDGHAQGRLVEDDRPALANRHADRGRLLPPRRHPALRVARAALRLSPDRPRRDRPSAGSPDGRRSRLHFGWKRAARPVLQSELTSRTDPGGTGLPAFPRLLLAVSIAFVACLLAKLVSFDAPDLLLIWPCAGVAFAFAWRGGLRWSVPPA